MNSPSNYYVTTFYKFLSLQDVPQIQQDLEQKADEHGMTVQEFVAYLIREAINQSTVKIRTMVKN